MMIILVWAMTKTGLIGNNNRLPWFLPAELAFFKAVTINKTILMGRKTFANLKIKPLPQRKTIVVTNDPNYFFEHQDVRIVRDLNSVLKKYQHNQQEDLYICGGAGIYQATLAKADKLIVSIVNGEYEGDTYFPNMDLSAFKEVYRQQHPSFLQLIYERKIKNE